MAGAAGADDEAGTIASPVCLNCGTALIGAFCHRCGQSGHVHTTLRSVGHDLAHGLFHFEGRIWRTLPMLALRPGELTRRYIAGARARFVSPLALFLFGVLLLFAAVESIGSPIRPNAGDARNGQALTSAELGAEVEEARADVARLARERQAAVAAGEPTAAIDGQLAGVRTNLAGLTGAARIAWTFEHPAAGLTGPVTGWRRLDARIAAARADPTLAVVQVEANAHKFAWALIPLSLPFVWLVFAWRRAWRLYDHVVFVTYSQAAALLLLTVMAGVGALGIQGGPLLLLLPGHLLVQLRGAYRLGWWSAAWRALWLSGAAVMVLAAFSLVVLWLGTG